MTLPHPSDSQVQRSAEVVMRAALSAHLGLLLEPTTYRLSSGVSVTVDAADEERSVVAEMFARAEPAKAGQVKKVLTDAYKMVWLTRDWTPEPRRLLVFLDAGAARQFTAGQSKSWYAQALAETGVEVLVVEVDAETLAAVRAAQVTQFR